MKQYEDNGTSAPKITANSTDKKEKDLERQVRTLADQVAEQQKTIDRMHRDIVRLRTSINEVSARIK
jgi:predicted  nucleic acid-binding Zn-ribbon protein